MDLSLGLVSYQNAENTMLLGVLRWPLKRLLVGQGAMM